jgi:hypothetical protein
MEEALKGMGVQPNTLASGADAAMAAPNSLPAEADRKAVAAMSK